MAGKIGKKFKSLPKFRKQESKDNLRQLDINGRDCQEILNAVRHTYLDSNFQTAWELKSASLVENRELQEKYRAKKADMKEEGRNISDHYAFLVFRDGNQVPAIVKNGLKCRGLSYNGLGDSKMGVYVWRNADVQIRVSEGWGINMCTLMVFKMMMGKCKVIAPSTTPDNVIEPTPNFDSHVPQMMAKPSDTIATQIARSQIYLYEYNDDCEPTEFPRQCLPYALLVYEKSDNPIPKPIKAPTHQYAIRPSERIKLSRSSKRDEEPAKKPETKDKITAPNYAPEMVDLCVPRLSKADTKDRTEVVETMANSLDSLSQSSDRSEYGLCVPRLTSGLPSTRDGSEIRDAPSAASVSSVPPSDPRSQLSFLQTTMYQPSFGPSDDEAEMSPIVDEDGDTVLDLNALLQKSRMPSLPPINLPFITDTRQLRDDFNELEAGIPRDPRLHKASVPVSVQSDPRLRREDPRLQTRGEPPPRRHETRYEHKPKYRSSRMDNRDSRSDSTQSRERKKLSLGDYKKKVNAVSVQPEFFDPHEPLEPLHASIIANPNVQSVKNPLLGSQTLLQRSDPPNTTYSSQINVHRDPRLNRTQEASTSFRDPPVQIQSNTEHRDPRVLYTSDTSGVPLDPRLISSTVNSNSNLQNSGQYNQDQAINNETLVSEASAISGDFVHEPDDMAKALNELSDPDDTSQSPKRASSPEIDDPTLAGAMKKLVEHSADVSLFTEALKSLQESAADFGDQLNDPEFLVKKIAEKIEDLTQVKQEKERLERERSQKEKEILERINRDRLDKMEKERLAELEREERADALFMEGFEEGEDIDLRPKIIGKIIADIQSPDSVLSPDVSNDAKYGDSQVKCIPLETSGNVENKVDGGTSSALNEAMRKTLEELSKTEKQTAVNPNPRNRLRKSRFEPQVKGTENNSVEDLESIPVPPLPEKDQVKSHILEPKSSNVSQTSPKDSNHDKLQLKKGSLGELVRKRAQHPVVEIDPSTNNAVVEDRQNVGDRLNESNDLQSRVMEFHGSHEQYQYSGFDTDSPRGRGRGRGLRDIRGMEHQHYGRGKDEYVERGRGRFVTRAGYESRNWESPDKRHYEREYRKSRSPDRRHNERANSRSADRETRSRERENDYESYRDRDGRHYRDIEKHSKENENSASIEKQMDYQKQEKPETKIEENMQRLPFEKGMVNSPVMIKPKGIRLRNESHEHLDDDEDEDIDLRSGFPAHKNVLGGLKAKTGKPQIKFNLKNMSLSQNKGPQSESNEKYIDKHEDSEGRNQNIPAETLTTDKLSKNENKQSELYDPFDLSDVDERESVEMDLDSDMDKSDNEVVKVSVELDYGDVDLRSNDRSSNENSQQEHVGDYDFRKSQSRSLSPPGRESSSERKKRQTKFIDPFGLDEEFHPAHLAENISDSRLWDDTLKDNRSQTGFNKSGSSVKKVVQELSASQDSNSSEGPGMLFDAYSLGGKKETVMPLNEFGDYDWRQAESKEKSLRVSLGPGLTSYTDSQLKQFNESIHSLFPHGVQRPNPNADITIQRQQNQHVIGDTPSSSQSGDGESLKKVMLGLDFSNIKNILSTVKHRVGGIVENNNEGSNSEADNNQGRGFPNSDGPQQDSWNQQKEKPGLAIPGFGGFDEPVMDNIPQSAKEFSHGKFGKNASEDSKNASGFGPVSKDSFWNSEHRWGRNKTDTDDRNRGNVEKHEVAKTSKGVSEKLKGVEKEEVKLDMKSVFDAEARKIKPGKVSSLTAEKKIDQGNYSTPKSKNQYDDDDFDDDISTPLPDISYQSALLESMEQSALKLRGDDDETPYKDYRTLEKTPYGKIATDSETDRKSRKRILESSLESFTIPVSKQSKLESVEDFITLDDSDKDIDDDSDDDDEGLMIASDVEEEDEGLVIDLCPTTPTTKSSSKKKIPDEEETSVDDNQEDPRAETPTIIDDEPTETIGAELESDPNHMEIASSSNEMRSAIEKSRKNMVIKFKGDTKKVNPKTGKTYSENIGSSIEVVGQSSRVKKDTSSPQSINNQNLTSTSQSSILHLPLSTASLQHQSDFPVGKFKPIGSTEPKITKPSTPETESSPVNMFAPIEEMQDKVSPPVSQVPYRMLPPLPSTVIPVNQLAQSLSGQPLKFDTGSSILPPLLPFPVQRQLFHPHSGGPHHLPGHGYGPAESSQASASSSLDRSSKDPYEWFKDKVDPSPGPKSLDAKDPANWFADKIGKKETKCEEDFRSKSKDYSDSEMKAKRQKKRKKKDKESPRKSSRKIKSEHDHSPSPKKIKYEMDGRNKSESPKKLEKKRHSEIKLERESPSYFEKRGQSQRQEESDSKNLITADEINQDNIIRDVSNLKSDVDGQTLKTSGEGKKCVNEFGNKILESLSEVKKVKKTTNDKPQSTESPKNIHEMKTASTPEKIRNKVAKPLPVKIDLSIKEKKDIQSPVKTTEKMKKDDGLIVIESDESELEDGEISDDSDDGVEEIVNDRKDTRTVVEHYSRSASERLGPYHRDQSDYLDTPKRNVNFRNDYDVRQGRRYTSKGEKGAQYWSDIISNPDTREERVKATRIESPSLRKLEPTVHKDTELLKSVASFTKAKQKVQAVCQAKTLEEWLKVELETDSVEHLKDIVPYPLHTDLTTFPKARRRKVKLKVKQTIEQEAKKRGQTAPFASSSQQASSTLQSDQQSHIEVEETYKNESYQNIPSYTRNQQNFQHGQFGQRFNQQGGYQQRNDPPWNQKRQYQNRGQGGRGNNITVGERGNNVNISERGNNLNIGGRGNNINISCNQPGQRNAPAHQPEVVVINDELDQVTPEKQPQTDPNFIKISYSPEVHNDQLERELALVKRTLLEINNRVPKSGPNFTSLNESESFRYRMKVLEDKRKVVALNMVEGEIRTLLNKTSFYGYPHRRVPEELLLNSERNTFKSLEEDVFLILMMPISVKPYMKLLQMKLNIEEKLHLKENAQTPTEVKEINDQLNSMHSQRQSLLRSFTGYLNKKRIQKIQDTVDKYTLVYEHFKGLMPPTPDSMLKHVRTTQMDLRQHLILAKQYMAMDELHHNPPAV